MSITTEVNYAEKVLAGLAKDTASIYVVDRFLGNTINQGESMLMRNAKRGFLWTTAQELENEVLMQNSNFRQQNFLTFYNAVVSAGVEATNLHVSLDNAFNGFLPQSEIKDAFTTAVILQIAKKLGDTLENNVVKNISSLFK